MDIKKNLKKEISIFYLNNFLRGVAFSLVGIFIPIYLLTLGFSLTQVFIYFLIFHLVTFLCVPLSLILARKIGYKILIISSIFFVIAFLILLNFLESYRNLFYLIPIIGGIETAFYFIPLHSFFTRVSENDKRGTQFSNYSALGQVSGLLGPLIGGFIAVIFGFKFLFNLTIIFLVISVIPLFKIKDVKPVTKLHFNRVLNLGKKHKRFFLVTMADDIRSETEGIIWPIFVFLTLTSVVSVGWIGTLVALGTLLFTLFVGRFYDKRNKYSFLIIGGLVYSFIWIGRIFFQEPIYIYAFSILAGFFGIMIAIPYGAIFYDKSSKEEDTDEFIIVREIPTFIARTFLWILMILVVNKFLVGFILAAITSLYFITIKFKGLD